MITLTWIVEYQTLLTLIEGPVTYADLEDYAGVLRETIHDISHPIQHVICAHAINTQRLTHIARIVRIFEGFNASHFSEVAIVVNGPTERFIAASVCHILRRQYRFFDTLEEALDNISQLPATDHLEGSNAFPTPLPARERTSRTNTFNM